MAEAFPTKKEGERLGASHVNNLNRVALDHIGRFPGSFTSGPFPGGGMAGEFPFHIRVMEIMKVYTEPSDEYDNEDDESSYSSSSSHSHSSVSVSSSSSSSSTNSAYVYRDTWYEVMPLYYDRDLQDWTYTGEGPWELDASMFPGDGFRVGDRCLAYWDGQRGRWIAEPPTSRGRAVGGCDKQNAWIDITMLGSATSGSFVLSQTINAITESITIPYNATATQVRDLYEAHSEAGIGTIETSGGPFPNATIRVKFTGYLGNKDIDLPTASWTLLLPVGFGGIICALAKKGHA